MDSNLSDVGAERAGLAGLFSYGLESYIEISDLLSYGSFAHQNNQVIYKCIEKILNNDVEVDLPSILAASEQLNLSGVIKTNQELEYIKSLMDFPIKKENVVYFAAQIKKFELARKAKKIANKITKALDSITGDESIDEIINLIENPITDFFRQDDIAKKPEKLGDDIDQ